MAQNATNLIKTLDEYMEAGKNVLATHSDNPPGMIGFATLDNGTFQGWKARCLAFITSQLGSDHEYTKAFQEQVKKGYRSQASAGIKILEAIKEDIEAERLNFDEPTTNVFGTLETLAEKFHVVARQLRRRHGQRPTLDVNDEYDVQDLLHALLLLFFSDVRDEEWTPSYAGGASRMDFLLKNEEIVIETKKTRKSMTASDLGSELLTDIARYKSHPSCGAMLCFVYDPEGLLPNPKGIENDLKREKPFPVRVLIRP